MNTTAMTTAAIIARVGAQRVDLTLQRLGPACAPCSLCAMRPISVRTSPTSTDADLATGCASPVSIDSWTPKDVA